jgi:hypothetical protein
MILFCALSSAAFITETVVIDAAIVTIARKAAGEKPESE